MEFSNAMRLKIISIAKSKKLKFTDLSKKSGIKYSTLLSFLNGKHKTITIHNLNKICIALDTTLQEFFDDKMFIDVIDETERKSKK